MTTIYYVLMFLSVALGTMAILSFSVSSQTEKRVQDLVQPGEKSNWSQTVVQIVGPFARLSTPSVKWENSPLRIRFLNAGIRGDNAPLIYFGLKTILPLIFAGAGYLALQVSAASVDRNTMLLLLLLAALVGCYLPNLVIWRIASVRRREVFESFPDAADLMLICVEAGLGLDSALTRVASEIQIKSVVLAQEIHLTNLEIRAGIAREHALRNLGVRTGIDEVSTFASMLSQSDKFGSSVGESLRIFSEDLRHKRQILAEELAAKVSTKMLFPLVLCIFPAISVVVLGPALIRIWNTVLPMLAGQPVT